MNSDLTLKILPENEQRFGPCACCGNRTRRVWGYVYSGKQALAAYYVEWTPGHGNEANFDLILGKWGEETTSMDRVSVAAEYKLLDNGPAFRIIDASSRPYANSSLVSGSLTREQVLSGSDRQIVFDVLDIIYTNDPRISDLRQEHGASL